MKRNYFIIILGLALFCLPIHLSYGQGARYTGSYKKSATISHFRKSNFVIEGLEISSTGDVSCINLDQCENVIIKNCKFGPSPITRALYLNNCKNITIIDCTFENVQSALRVSTSQGIKFEYNDVTNILGKSRGSTSLGNMTQFIKVYGEGNSVSYNVCENISGQSSTEDIISIYSSNGTAQSPITVKGNWIRGGGPSTSGGGINLGDGSGSYQIAEDNILVDPGQFGIGIAGGHNMTLRNNKVFGKKQSFTNIAIGANNWYEQLGKSHTITIEKNTVNFISYNGNIGSWWIGDNIMSVVKGFNTNKYDPTMTASILPTQIIGRARSSSSTPPPNSGEGTTPLPEDKPEENPNPIPNPVPKPDPTPDPTPNPGLPNIKNDPSIQIYLDNNNRVCVNVQGSLVSSAEIIGADSKLNIIYRQPLKRFHTVLPTRPAPGNYSIMVMNGSKQHLKTLYVP